MADDGELASLGGAPPDSDPEPIGSRRRITVVATVVLLVAGVVAVLLFFGPSLVGLDKGVKAAEDSDPLWLIGAFVPSALAFFFYAWLFHQVIHRSTPPLVSGRFTWSTTMVSTMAGQAATRIVSAGGAGAAAVLAWVLRRAGLEARETGSRLIAFLVLLYVQYFAALIIFGLGLGLGIFPGSNPPALTLVPAGLGALFALLLGLMLLLPTAVEGLIGRLAGGKGRSARLGRKLLSVPAAMGDGVRLALVLMRQWRCAVRVIAAATGYWACNIAVLWMAMQAVGEPVSVFVVVQAFYVGMLANLVPLLPGGAGTVEGAIAATLIAFGEPAGAAVAAALTYRLIAFWIPSLPAFAAWARLPAIVRRWESPPAPDRALTAQVAVQRREDPDDC